MKLEQSSGTHEVGLSVLSVGDYIFSPAYTVPVGTWTHLAFVGTSAGTSLYVNGAFKASLTNSIPLPRYYIGSEYITSSVKYVDFMQGSLDEIMLFNTALTPAQISAIYGTGSSGLWRAPQFFQHLPIQRANTIGFERPDRQDIHALYFNQPQHLAATDHPAQSLRCDPIHQLHQQ